VSVSAPAIRIEGLTKRYRLGENQGAYRTLRETLASAIERRWKGQPAPASDGVLVALQDVSFDVAPGQVVGIIGRNGAGKSTLLKVLSRVTEPSAGRVEVRGRLASLLEVGTGFHPELTGRENIFLNGAILGMSRREVRANFTDIVAFAGVERLIDTPVKRYSSGLYLRLAFAVAAHLEPEILLVDEVLAVGDFNFQRKCLRRMNEVASHGRTVLFVSHNMPAVEGLCTRAIVLENGRVAFDGPSRQAILHYLESQARASRIDLETRTDRIGDGRIRFVRMWFQGADGRVIDTARSGDELRVVLEYRASDTRALGSVSLAVAVDGRMGERITMLWSEASGAAWTDAPSRGRLVCRVPRLPLNAGQYALHLCGRVNDVIADWIYDAATLKVAGGDFFRSGRLPDEAFGNILFEQEWALETDQSGRND
jgi:lipopolysaccharide transport system ATP-binding protein